MKIGMGIISLLADDSVLVISAELCWLTCCPDELLFAESLPIFAVLLTGLLSDAIMPSSIANAALPVAVSCCKGISSAFFTRHLEHLLLVLTDLYRSHFNY